MKMLHTNKITIQVLMNYPTRQKHNVLSAASKLLEIKIKYKHEQN